MTYEVPSVFADRNVHAIGELRKAEAWLYNVRKADRALSDIVREGAASVAWAAERNKELLPLFLYAGQVTLGDEVLFRRTSKDSRKESGVDVEIVSSAGRTLERLQITLAFPKWDKGNLKDSNPGYQQQLVNEIARRDGFADEYAVYRRVRGRICCVDAEGELLPFNDEMRSCEEVAESWLSGLMVALEKKARSDGRGCRLLVYAKGFSCGSPLSSSEFRRIARRAADLVQTTFGHVSIFSADQGWLFQR